MDHNFYSSYQSKGENIQTIHLDKSLVCHKRTYKNENQIASMLRISDYLRNEKVSISKSQKVTVIKTCLDTSSLSSTP